MTQQVLSIISICFCFSAFSQKAEVMLSASNLDIEVGETVRLKVESTIKGTLQFDLIPILFNDHGSIAHGMNYTKELGLGIERTTYTHTKSGSFSRSGTYTIGPAVIKSASGETYESNIVSITISAAKKVYFNCQLSEQQRSDDAFGVIQTSKSSVFKGESFVSEAKVFSRFQLSEIGKYNTFIQEEGIEFQVIPDTSRQLKLRPERFDGIDYITFEYDQNLVFPSDTGLFIFDPFTMDIIYSKYHRFTLKSNSTKVRVKPLPKGAPNNFIGAVGQFAVASTIDTNNVKQGDVFKLTVEIEGIGNIQNSLEPEINLPKGLVVYGDPIITKDISYSENGAEGTISFDFNIKVSTSGKVNIPRTFISYFDPTIEQYVTVATAEHSIYAVNEQNPLAPKSKDLKNKDSIDSEVTKPRKDW